MDRAPVFRLRALAGTAALWLALGVPARGQAAQRAECMPLAPFLAQAVDSAYQHYRTGALALADAGFARVLTRCPGEPGALTGRGLVALRQGDLLRARDWFTRSLAVLPTGYDALSGLGMVAYRQGDLATARSAFTRALAQVPADSVSQWYLSRLPDPEPTATLPPVRRPSASRVDARVGVRILEVPGAAGVWRPLWLKGVNIGAALPGRHPSEFPQDDGTYERWLELIAGLGANVVRVYTIHPPHFYRALGAWNQAHPDAPLWLIHGVWTEPPPGPQEARYDDPGWRAAFRAEQRRVVDLLHGHAALPRRPGHASGAFTVDVSRWVLAYIIGREWEPYSVAAYNARHPERTAYRGRFVETTDANPTEVWLAEECDALVGYEMDTYNTQRPIAYTNWPTLDPLRHPTESTRDEENRMRRGRLPEPIKEYDNDAVGLDAVRMQARDAFPAGVFASYHAYPYYPDFLVLDPGYRAARSPEGPSAYYGYLRELVAHHGTMPVVISEYGVPSSRGIAHAQPQGWHHGGHSEVAQAELDARLTRDIHASGAAGAVLFAIIDEWFKKNWVVIDFEVPAERNRLWLNPLDAEQNYGIVAMRPGRKDRAITIDGQSADWEGAGSGRLWDAPPAEAGARNPLALRGFRVLHDAAYVYLRLDVPVLDWARGRYVVGIDTYRRDLGGFRLPRVESVCTVGFEFAIDLRGPDSSMVLVDRPYLLHRPAPIVGANPPETMPVFNRPWKSLPHQDLKWDTLRVQTNRARIGRDGTRYPAQSYFRNLLLHADQRQTTLADWYADPASGTIELRIPWGMLHVLDPSSRQVLHGVAAGDGPGSVATDGFRFALASYDPASPTTRYRTIGCAAGEPPLAWTWPGWEEPEWYPEIKPVFEAMRQTFRALPAGRR